MTEPGKALIRRSRYRILETDEGVAERFILAIKNGNYLNEAAQYAGVSRDTAYEWVRRGQRELDRVEAGGIPYTDEAVYADFAMKVLEAQGEARVRALQTIRRAADNGQWVAAAWYLERTAPHLYGRRKAEDGEPDTVKVGRARDGTYKVTLGEVRGLIAKVLEARGVDPDDDVIEAEVVPDE